MALSDPLSHRKGGTPRPVLMSQWVTSNRGVQTTGVRVGPYTHTATQRARAKGLCSRSRARGIQKKAENSKGGVRQFALTQRIWDRSSPSFMDYCNRGVVSPWYITTVVLHPMYQPFSLLNHQRDARPDRSSQCHPHWEWNVLVSSQARRVCGQSHQPNLVFRWDYLTTLWLEFRLIKGKMKLRWPLVCPFLRSFCTRTQSSRFHTSSPAIRAWDL